MAYPLMERPGLILGHLDAGFDIAGSGFHAQSESPCLPVGQSTTGLSTGEPSSNLRELRWLHGGDHAHSSLLAILLLILSGIFLFGSGAHATETGSVSEEQGLRQEAMASESAAWGIVVVGGASILAAPVPEAEILQQAAFLQRIAIEDTSSDPTGRTYFRVAEGVSAAPGTQPVPGWIDAQDCLTIDRAYATAGKSPFMKAIVVDNRGGGPRSPDPSGRVSLLDHPGERRDGPPPRVVAVIPVPNVAYVFARDDAGPSGAFYLLGDAPVTPSLLRSGDSILGWLPESRLFLWEGRQAVSFSKKTLAERCASSPAGCGAKLFDSVGALVAATRGLKRVEPLVTEDASVTSWPFDYPRFPVMQVEDGADYGVGAAGAVLRVLYFGEPAASAPALTLDTQSETGAPMETVASIAVDTDRIDLMIAAPATSFGHQAAMQAQSALRRLLERGGKSPAKEVRLGMTFYCEGFDSRSQKGGSTKVADPTHESLLPTADLSDVERWLGSLSWHGGEGPCALPGLLPAIHDFLARSLSLSSTGAYRVLIVVGEGLGDSQEAAGMAMTETIASLRANISAFAVLHAATCKEITATPGASAFRKTVTAIMRELPDETTEYICGATSDKLEQTVLEYCRGALASARLLHGLATLLGTGEVSLQGASETYGAPITGKLVALLRARGVKRGMLGGNCRAVPAWVAEHDVRTGLEQVQHEQLVTRAELEALIGILHGLIKGELGGPTGLLREWTRTLTIYDESYDRKDSIARSIERVVRLPIRNETLQLTAYQIAQLPSDELETLFASLKSRLARLRAIVAERDIRPKGGDAASKGPLNGDSEWVDVGPRSYWFGTRKELAWVPAEVLP